MVWLPNPNPAFLKIQLLSLYGIAGIIELICGGMVTVGLYTRAAAFIMSGEMAVAYFMNRPMRGFAPITNGGTLEVLDFRPSAVTLINSLQRRLDLSPFLFVHSCFRDPINDCPRAAPMSAR